MPLKFAYICDLLEKLESLIIRDVPILPQEREAAVRESVTAWFKSHHALVNAPDTDRVALLSTLLPEKRTDRVYGLQEQGLVRILGRCLGMGRERLQALNSWTSEQHEDLATLVYRLQNATDTGTNFYHITVEEIDNVLRKVASRCVFSGPKIRLSTQNERSTLPDDVLRPLLTRLTARELKWVIRLILKRFHPVELDERLILQSLHPLLPRLLQFQSTFDAAVRILDSPLLANLRSADDRGFSAEVLREITSVYLKPQLGVKVGRPDFHKARSIKHCLQIAGKSRWAIEPKYDGEYCQLHIDLTRGRDAIQIFSKSGKDSTKDRRHLHTWIKLALRLGEPDCKFKTRCILEGEMVVYSDKDNSILGFDKIRKYVDRSGRRIGTESDSPRKRDEQLMIVFFDALLIDDDVVMAETYEVRRRRLLDLVFKYPGYCTTADWGMIDFKTCGAGRATRKVNKLFAKAIARRCEGLILKPCDGPYFALDQSTVAGKVIKLKKDYIPGLGDTADFAIIGARRSAAEMSKSSLLGTRWTDFIIACVQNKSEVCRYQARPVLRVLDVLSRPCISVPDMQWICDNGKFHTEDLQADGIQSNFDIMQELQSPSMTVVFKKPFIVEVLGSSFDKPSSKNYYALRHARVLKIHRDRGLEDVIGFDELQELAYQAKRLPADIQAEETEWLSKLQASCKSKGEKRISQASNTTTATRSPGSTVPSPRKPVRMPQPALVRIDTVELLPGEERTSQASNTTLATRSPGSTVPSPRKPVRLPQPSLVRIDTADLLPGDLSPLQARTRRSAIDAASLQTPPPSSPLMPMEQAMSTRADLPSRKRKRPSNEATLQGPVSSFSRVLPVSQSAADISATTSGHIHSRPPIEMMNDEVTTYARPLANITNTPPRPDPPLRSQTGPSRHETPLLSHGYDGSSKRTRSSRALCRSAKLLQIIDVVPSSPSNRMSDLSLGEVPSSPQSRAAHTARTERPSSPLVQAVDSGGPNATQTRINEALPTPRSSAPIANTETPPNASAPTNVPAPPPPPALRKPQHPFSNHTFHLAPCIRHTPYLTENLLPLLFSPTLCSHLFASTPTPSSSSSDAFMLSPQVRIVDKLEVWIRDLEPTRASAATLGGGVNTELESSGVGHARTIPESQAHEGMQKTVLVEPRRVQQTREMVDRLCATMVLKPALSDPSHDSTIEHALEVAFSIPSAAADTANAGETVQLWDWRVTEDVVQLMLTQRSRVRNLPGACVGAADEDTRRDIEDQIPLDSAAELDAILQKRYLGCVAWSRVLGANVWCDAGLAREMGNGLVR